MKRNLLASLIWLSVAGCATFGGDMIIRVSGAVPAPDEPTKREGPCGLLMVSSETGERSIAKDVPNAFSTPMMVVAGPKPKAYYFLAVCGDGHTYRSSEVIISSRGSRGREIELGTLIKVDVK